MRGVKITTKGMKYNNSLYKPSAQDIINKQQQEIEELQKFIKEVTSPNRTDIAEEENPPKEEEPQEEKHEKKQSFNEFVESITKEVGATGEPICNQVKGWQKETIFYINSYNKLSIITPSGEYKQLKDPREINKFWSWLYRHQDRVGVVYDFTKPLDLTYSPCLKAGDSGFKQY